jgi:transketolase C-terminal domain/subunit
MSLDLKYTYTEKKDTRSGFGDGFLEAGRRNPNVVGLCADLIGSLKMGDFQKEFPDRFFQTGIAEANMIGLAAGMALGGKIPFTGTFANFATGRVYDQIRQSVAYSDKNVKICASHAGLTLGEDGVLIFEKGGNQTVLPTVAREVFDVSGAGDTVTAALSAALAAGTSLHLAGELANLAAGIAVSEIGTVAVTADKIRDVLLS